jgi:hypothetical protein
MVKLQEEENRTKHQESSNPPVSNDEMKNLASTLFKDQNIDLGQVVNMASNLAANENLMKSVIDFAKLKSGQPAPLQTTQNAHSDQLELSKQMGEMATELAKVKLELQRLKEQNEEIKQAIMSIHERANKKFLGLF